MARPGFTEIATKLLNDWELRALILLSLSLHVTLAILGSLRKHNSTKTMVTVATLAYAAADPVAVVAIGILTRPFMGQSVNVETKIHSLDSIWTALMLLHLGGPDTITADSLVDHEMWLRQLFNLLANFANANYVLFWSGLYRFTYFQASFMVFLVFITGIVKYGERILAISLSTTKKLTKFLPLGMSEAQSMDSDRNWDKKFLIEANFLYGKLNRLCAGNNLHIREGLDCNVKITSLNSAERAFQMVEFELGLLYDVLYTKAKVIYRPAGILIRCFTVLGSVYALFVVLTFYGADKHNSHVDILITCILLFGSIGLELYGLMLILTSDWTKLWLVRHPEMIGVNRWLNIRVQGEKRSRNIRQCSLIDDCIKTEAVEPLMVRVKKKLGVYEKVYQPERVDAALQRTIFQQLEQWIGTPDNLNNAELRKKLLNYRGDFVLERTRCLKELKWSTIDVDFDHSLLLWHIATDLCYHDDYKNSTSETLDYLITCSKISRYLSGYMLYVLVKLPKMLPMEIGDIRYEDTCDHATKLFEDKKVVEKENAREVLIRQADEEEIEEGSSWKNGLTPKSVLFEGCRLAKQLQSLKWPNQDKEAKWEMMNQVWVELLAYAASRSEWGEHARQLTNGGEFLTDVCLLMAYLGLSEQYYS